MTDDLLELEKLLPELPAAVERRRIGANLGKAAAALQDAPRQIERLKALVDISRETDFEKEPNQAATVQALLTAANDTAKTMMEAETADHLRDVQDAYKEFIVALAGLDRQLRPHWRRVVARDFAPLSAIGNLLERINKTSNLGRRLSACGRKAEQVSDGLSAEALRETILQLRQERLALESERTSLTKDPEVDQFLDALAEGDATLRMVTQRVHDWLDQNHALDNFSITPRS